MIHRISLLLAARRRSRFLSHFLFSYFTRTKSLVDTELLVMASECDDWNRDLFKFFENYPVKFFFVSFQLIKTIECFLFPFIVCFFKCSMSIMISNIRHDWMFFIIPGSFKRIPFGIR